MQLNVLHTVSSLHQNSGGPSRSVTALCNHIGKKGISVTLLSMDSADQLVNCVQPNYAAVKLISAPGPLVPFLRVRCPFYFSRSVSKLNRLTPLQIIHDHGMWLPCNHASASSAFRLNVPWVVSPRGMLEPWAMNFKAWKKKLVWQLWSYHDLQKAKGFCATSAEEAKNIYKLGFRQPIAVIPNGVDLIPSTTEFKRCRKTLRKALFLSRIHPKKGVCELVEAWARLNLTGWELVLAGPDENGYAAEVKRCISQHGVNSSVHLIGSVDGEEKWRLYRESELFILPTFSENFGIVIAESLAMGTPVITTKGAPWESLIQHKCGWWIDIGVDPLMEALAVATALSDEDRHAMGVRGRNFVGQEFAWEFIAEKMKLFYLWLLGMEEKPDFVCGD